MKLLSLARRMRTAAHLFRHYPRLVLRLPFFVQRMFAEGLLVTLRRLRDLSDPLGSTRITTLVDFPARFNSC